MTSPCRCGAKYIEGLGLWSCGSSPSLPSAVCQRNQVVRLCRRYASPAVNPGAHALASKVLEILGAKTGDDDDR